MALSTQHPWKGTGMPASPEEYLALVAKPLMKFGVRPSVAAVKRELDWLRFKSDSDIVAEAQSVLTKDRPEVDRNSRASAVLPDDQALTDLDVYVLAVAIEAFRRAPADLPDGSYLYEPQIEAALHVVLGRVVQMDTGEGKTYALLPAAFALTAKYRKVYVLCANEYLAARDARRTKSYWDYVGLDVGLCTRSAGTNETSHPEWSRPVIYTVRDVMTFKALGDDLATNPSSSAPLIRSAILIDEVDSVLFDQGSDHFRRVVGIGPGRVSRRHWAQAFKLANELEADKHIVASQVRSTAALTAVGVARVDSELESANPGDSERHLLRKLVEEAYVAGRVVERDVHYSVGAGQVVAINQLTGAPEPGVNHSWISAVEHLEGIPPRPISVPLLERRFSNLAAEFAIVGGMSGTASHVAADLFWAYGPDKLPVTVKPRHVRMHGEERDETYRTRAAAVKATVARAVVEAATRPVLVGTNSVAEAREIFEMLRKPAESEGYRLQIVTDVSEDGARVLEDAGSVGSITIATLTIARGVDIPLKVDALDANGFVLLIRGRTREGRLDRQFLGRVGRQGQPFTAQFLNSLEDDLLQQFAADRVDRIMRRLDMPEDTPIEHPMVSRAIARAQSISMRFRRMSQATARLMAYEDHLLLQVCLRWLESTRPPRGESAMLPEEFIGWAVGRYVDTASMNILDAKLVALMEEDLDDFHLARHLSAERSLDGTSSESNDAEVLARVLKSRCEAQVKKNRSIIGHRRRINRHLTGVIQFRREGLSLLASVAPIAHTFIYSTATAVSLEDIDRRVASWKALVAGIRHRRTLLMSTVFEMLLALPARISIAGAMHHDRNELNAVRWSILSYWSRVLEGLERNVFVIAHDTGASYQRSRQQIAAVHEQIRRGTVDLPRKVMRTLLRLGEPTRLDDEFFIPDHRAAVRDESSQTSVEWQAATWSSQSPINHTAFDAVAGFVASESYAERKSDATPKQVTTLLEQFLDRHPLSTLQRGESIAKAIHDWQDYVRAIGVSASIRRVQTRLLSRFFQYLHHRGLVRELPKRSHRVRVAASRLITNVRSAPVLLPLALALMALAALAIGLLPLPVRGSPPTGAWWLVADQLMTAGLLTQGRLGGPIVAAIVTGVLVGLLVTRRYVVVGVSPEAFILLAGAVALWRFAVFPRSAFGAVLALAAMIFARLLLQLFTYLTMTTRVDAGTALHGAVLFIAIGAWTRSYPSMWVTISSGVVVVSLLLVKNKERLRVAVPFITRGSSVQMIETSLDIGLQNQWIGHAVGLAASVAFAASGGDRSGIGLQVLGVHSTTALAFIVASAYRTFDVGYWRTRLAERSQVPTLREGESLGSYLGRARRRLLGREVAGIAVLTAASAVTIADVAVPGTTIYLAPLALAAVTMATTEATYVVSDSLAFISGSASVVPGASDFSVGEVESERGVKGVLGWFRKSASRFALLVAATWFVLTQIAEAVGVFELVARAVSMIGRSL